MFKKNKTAGKALVGGHLIFCCLLFFFVQKKSSIILKISHMFNKIENNCASKRAQSVI